ncbi:ABC transporter permease [Serinibacter arcticus]|uniref:ABC transporter permease n=1 Tax=Serinibacter arcticus TaxID=1655435 RepID=A0A2U1ZTV3_9MICO|nr:ABC transporter permease [Serinibacter arcticus]PWD50417.1 ABC transporter permease [Serinibacter arcticus]
MFADFIAYLADGTNWAGTTGILNRLVQHLYYSGLALGIGAVIAVPLGLVIGHTGKGEGIIVGLANTMRALPSLGLMTLLVLLMSSTLIPPITALVLLAVPPLLAGVYAGIANVDRSAVDAARAMGMTEWQVLWRVEVPNALPLIVGGLRGATLQVVATATIAAFVNLGGLGRYIFDGLALYDYTRVFVGAVLVTALALVLDGLLALVVRLVQPGTGRLALRDPALLAAIDERAPVEAQP